MKYSNLKKALLRNQRNIVRIHKLRKLFRLYPILFSILSILFLVIFISTLVWLFANLEWFELKSKNELGDAFGGLSNPIIAFIGVIVTFLAFYIQYKFNIKQNELIKEQRKLYHIDKFDNKFSESLRIHIDNVKEFNIDNKFHSRKTFVYMYKELEFIYLLIADEYDLFFKQYGNRNDDEFKFLHNLNITEISYNIFYHGIEHYFSNKSPNITDIKSLFYNNLHQKFESIQQEYFANKDIDGSYEYSFDDYHKREIFFYPFDGHSNRLGHYFRHLHNFCQSISNENKITIAEKKSYFNLIRAQLSNYEQSLIYYNAISWFPSEWHEFFVKYKLIKNLPLELSRIGIKPEKFYENDIKALKQKDEKMFYWVKIN